MASVNKVIIIGNLGRDPELRYLAAGDAVANLAIATSYKPKDKPEVTEWHRVVLFARLAEIAGQYLKKGASVYIEGRLQTRKYNKDGVDHYATEIVGESMKMLGDAREAAPPAQASTREDRQNRQRPAPQSAPGRGASGYDDLEDPAFR